MFLALLLLLLHHQDSGYTHLHTVCSSLLAVGDDLVGKFKKYYSSPGLLKMWFPDQQHQYHLGAYLKCQSLNFISVLKKSETLGEEADSLPSG